MNKKYLQLLLYLLCILLIYYFGLLFFYITSGFCVYTFRSVIKTLIFCSIYLIPFVYFEKSIKEVNKNLLLTYKVLGLLFSAVLLIQILVTIFHDHNH
jgi:hypothetical protein